MNKELKYKRRQLKHAIYGRVNVVVNIHRIVKNLTKTYQLTGHMVRLKRAGVCSNAKHKDYDLYGPWSHQISYPPHV